jgi:Luciferase-like monooxygenase
MRFTLMLSRGEHQQFQAIARAAEESGWTSITIPDSLFFPRATDSKYPYADTDNIWSYISATPFIEPVVAMTWMAAVTKTLRFYPAVMKVPVRQPLVLAKARGDLARSPALKARHGERCAEEAAPPPARHRSRNSKSETDATLPPPRENAEEDRKSRENIESRATCARCGGVRGVPTDARSRARFADTLSPAPPTSPVGCAPLRYP